MLPKKLIELAHRERPGRAVKVSVYPIALKLRLSLYLPVAQAVTERYTRNFTCKHEFFNFSQDVSVDFGKTLCYGKDHALRTCLVPFRYSAELCTLHSIVRTADIGQ